MKLLLLEVRHMAIELISRDNKIIIIIITIIIIIKALE